MFRIFLPLCLCGRLPIVFFVVNILIRFDINVLAGSWNKLFFFNFLRYFWERQALFLSLILNEIYWWISPVFPFQLWKGFHLLINFNSYQGFFFFCIRFLNLIILKICLFIYSSKKEFWAILLFILFIF